jgi:CubicO group peptidase (beta-lactamase class C family)
MIPPAPLRLSCSPVARGPRVAARACVLAIVMALAVATSGRNSWSVRAQPAAPTIGLQNCPSTAMQPVDISLPLLAEPAVAQALTALGPAFVTAQTANGLPSLSGAVVYNQSVIWAQSSGCADLTQRTAATPTTVYGVGSVSKMMTATMLMLLRDAGKLNLDDPVDMYVPGASYLLPDGGGTVSPTFLQLASHSSGLPRDMTPEPTSMAQLLQQLQQTTAVFAPGTDHLYSNLGFMLLGQVLASIAGETFESYVTQQILQPLGMSSSGYAVRSTPAAGVATPYYFVSYDGPNTQFETRSYLDWGLQDPAAGFTSTAMDMTRFLMLQFGTAPVGGAQILSASTLAEMRQVVTGGGPNLVGYGTGWEVYTPGPNNLDWLGKDGYILGFQAQLLYVPALQLGVFVVANSGDPADLSNTMLKVAQAMLEQLAPAFPPASAN